VLVISLNHESHFAFEGSKASKADLQAIVAEYEKYNDQKLDDLKKICASRGTTAHLLWLAVFLHIVDVPVSGSKGEVVSRLLLFDRYDKMDEESLRAKCRKDGKRYKY
jgi:hypothetical protein